MLTIGGSRETYSCCRNGQPFKDKLHLDLVGPSSSVAFPNCSGSVEAERLKVTVIAAGPSDRDVFKDAVKV